MAIHLTERPEGKLKRAIIASFVISIILLGVKFAAYLITDSAAILSDATESIINVIATAFAFLSLKISFLPPDDQHPYGHGKVEFFSAAFEGGAILVAAIWIIYKAVSRIVAGPVLQEIDIGIWLVAVSVIVNLGMGVYLVHFGKKAKSLILEADGKHLLTDVVTSVGVIVGLIIMLLTDWLYLDSIIAIVIAMSIIRTSWKLLRRAGGGMMDASNAEEDSKIKEIIGSYQSQYICGYHNMRHRHSGKICFVDFHLFLPRFLSIEKAHEIATRLEGKIAKTLGDASVMAHIEPCSKPDCPKCKKEV